MEAKNTRRRTPRTRASLKERAARRRAEREAAAKAAAKFVANRTAATVADVHAPEFELCGEWFNDYRDSWVSDTMSRATRAQVDVVVNTTPGWHGRRRFEIGMITKVDGKWTAGEGRPSFATPKAAARDLWLSQDLAALDMARRAEIKASKAKQAAINLDDALGTLAKMNIALPAETVAKAEALAARGGVSLTFNTTDED